MRCSYPNGKHVMCDLFGEFLFAIMYIEVAKVLVGLVANLIVGRCECREKRVSLLETLTSSYYVDSIYRCD